MSPEPATLDLPVVWSPDCLAHVPSAEIWVGVSTPGTEVPERLTVIRDALDAGGARLHQATRHDDDVLLAVHDADFVTHLSTVYDAWVDAGFPDHPGQDRVVPYVFPTDGMLAGMPSQVPTAIHGRAGLYCYDTMTLVGPGTWPGARAAVDVTLDAVDLALGGHQLAYALTRPPGHHVTRRAYGGSCYLNNAAVAAQALRQAGVGRVGIIDVDAHHGNGTQAIFYERPDVGYASVHVDPGAGWFPHYVGYADERGAGAGLGATRNVPLAPGTGDEGWLDGVVQCVEAVEGVDALVVSLGVDAAADDPESPLRVTHEGYRATGRLLGQLGVPTVVVQEGGYHLATLGSLVVGALRGLHGG
jgi:acetoin utilization deacetylase AcuC-like enzyme